MRYIFFLIIILFTSSCARQFKMVAQQKIKDEIVQTEANFEKMAREKGIEKAFLHFAAAEAVMMRNDKILKGKENFKSYFKNPIWENAKLQWKPDFVDVAESGDLGYTYGSYTLKYIDSEGKEQTSNGIFHTVWKKQSDGQWKFVWD